MALRGACVLLLLGLAMGGATGAMLTLDKLTPDKVAQMSPGAPSGCADGSPFEFLVRKGTTPNRVLIDFMGGGACWNSGDAALGHKGCFDAQSISFQRGMGFWSLLEGVATDNVESAVKNLAGTSLTPIGFSNQIDDVKTWTYIFVPYCTQDVHLGTCDTTYARNGTQNKLVRHNGAANVKSVRDWVYTNFPAPDSLAFIGCSAGAAAAPYLEAARAAAHYAGKNTTIVAVGDSPTNLMTDEFAKNDLVKWGIQEAVTEVTAWTKTDFANRLQPNFFEEALSAILSKWPNLQVGMYTRTTDPTQLTFFKRMGGMVPPGTSDADAMKIWRRQNLAMLKRLNDRHSNFRSFVAAGIGHCGMTFDSPLADGSSAKNSTVKAEFKRWIEALLLRGTGNAAGGQGSEPAQWTCGSECTLGGVEGCDKVVGSNKLEDRCRKCDGDGSSCATLPAQSGSCPPAPPVATKEQAKDSASVRALPRATVCWTLLVLTHAASHSLTVR